MGLGIQVRGPMMVAGNCEPATMKIDVCQKDLPLIDTFATDLRCPTPLFAASLPIYAGARAQGRDKQDTAAVCAVLESMAALRR
jgi:L-threonate 2-dehydrogenase